MSNDQHYLTLVQVNSPLLLETVSGYLPIEWVIKIPNEDSCSLTFSTGQQLHCAKNHQLFTATGATVLAKHSLGVPLFSKNKLPIRVITIQDLGLQTCYDVQVKGHSYWSGPVLSHNSTISAIFLLHYILFNADKTVAILANKGRTSKEILRRIKTAYQKLPMFLQQGIVEWNKSSIELENGSRILAAATSDSNIRGESISVLYLDECLVGETRVTIKEKGSNEESIISLKQLHSLLENAEC